MMNSKTTDSTHDPVADSAGEHKESPESHPVAEAIDRFLHRVLDIRFAAAVFIPVSSEIMEKQYNDAKKRLEDGERLISSDSEAERIHGTKQVLDSLQRLDRFAYSDVPGVIESSLFLSLFSAFDAYTGELISALYKTKPDLFKRINQTVPFSDILDATSIDDIKKAVLEDEIESLRRKSYIEQFEYLESSFGLPLKAFDHWPDFVECGQRRNLLTHCGGIVSEQYRAVCKREGYAENKLAQIGTVLELGADYFLKSIELMMEVGLKLGQTLWRKLLPDELSYADDHLHNAQYDALTREAWDQAKVFGDFAVNQRQMSSDLMRRIATINYAIALKFSDEGDRARELLSRMDWSATINDFRLAEAVLSDRFGDAAEIMRRIGKTGEIVSEEAYHVWPLFRAFRAREEFIQAYQEIYGYPFTVKLKRAADAARGDASEALDRGDKRDAAGVLKEAPEITGTTESIEPD